jgi:hypothetical protein
MPNLPTFDKSNFPKLHVMHFGYEIEGLFDRNEFALYDDDDNRENEYYRTDGSVEASQSYEGEDVDDYEDGEIASPKFRIDRILQFRNFVELNMPIHTDDTCGLHIHASFSDALAFQKCCDVVFYEKFRKDVYRFMHNGLFSNKTVRQFESRFRGDSHYCKSGFNPDRTINGITSLDTPYVTTHGRYNDFNFEAYSKFGTIELRLLPASNNVEEVKNMVEWYLGFLNNYLDNVTPYERANFEKIDLEVDNETKHEEFLLCV